MIALVVLLGCGDPSRGAGAPPAHPEPEQAVDAPDDAADERAASAPEERAAPPTGLHGAPYQVVEEPEVRDHELALTVRYGGGCARHAWTLRPDPRTAEAPMTQVLVLHHDANGDTCRAVKQEALVLPLEDHLGPDCTDRVELRVAPGSSKERFVLPVLPAAGCS